jgi:hypothetical protein
VVLEVVGIVEVVAGGDPLVSTRVKRLMIELAAVVQSQNVTVVLYLDDLQ